MVFTREQQEKFAPSLNVSEYLVVRTDTLMFSEDQIRLRLGIEIVSVLNTVGMLERMLDQVGSSKKLDTSIMHEVLASLMRDHDPTLEKDELIEYFTFKQQLGEHNDLLERFADLSGNVLPYELDFALLGLSLEDYFFLKEDRQVGGLHAEYGSLNSELVYDKGSIENHIKKAKKLIETCKEEAQ